MVVRKLRFAFTIPTDGPDGLTCAGWRLWTHGEDTYLTVSDLGHLYKVSLHGDQSWRFAATAEHMAAPDPLWPKDRSRAMFEFEPIAFHDGHRLAFAVIATRGCLRPASLDEREIHIGAADRWDEVTIAQIWMSEPDAPRPFVERFIGEVRPLRSGRTVWVCATTERAPRGEPEEGIVSTMIGVLTPKEHGVPSPALIARGLRIG